MSTHPEISQRDLRMRSKAIMDAVEAGETYTVTREGREIAELVPLRQRRTFISRADFGRSSRLAPALSLERFREDQERGFDGELDDVYAR